MKTSTAVSYLASNLPFALCAQTIADGSFEHCVCQGVVVRLALSLTSPYLHQVASNVPSVTILVDGSDVGASIQARLVGAYQVVLVAQVCYWELHQS